MQFFGGLGIYKYLIDFAGAGATVPLTGFGANLAKGLAIEVSEVLELFLWQDEPTSLDDLKDELADVLVYVAYLCDKYNLDMDEIVNNKMTKNEKKYPVEKCYGKSTKYNKL